MVIALPPCQPSSAHLQGCVFHRLSEQPLPVSFPSHNDCFSCPIRNSLAQVVSAASHSHSFISGESLSFTLLQAGAGSKKLPSCRCLRRWCRICPISSRSLLNIRRCPSVSAVAPSCCHLPSVRGCCSPCHQPALATGPALSSAPATAASLNP